MTVKPVDLPLSDLPTAIAIIGMAGRFPGARTLDEFRRNLENGLESITVLSDRELLDAGVDPALFGNPEYVKAAPLLEDFDRFDAAFFDYSPREAAIMDPQQRLFLECAWEALEDAGHAADAYGSLTGVFSGAGGVMSTYLLSESHFNADLTGPTASLQHVGNDKDYLSTRVSYKLNLRGPSLTVQTACSTSLVAVHLACQSLLTRECDMALAGGTTVRIPQRAGYVFREGNVFSRDGHCRAFDARAEGTVFGSGIGVVVLKRLDDAIRSRDAIRAVIRATAVNNDGSENKVSYWAPHAEGQAEAMRRALAVARVEARTIGYVEAHGTATKKGDPTEIRALTHAFGTLPPRSCAIGSVKSNIGHPESAAGIAGLMKAALSLQHRVLFPSLHYSQPNPEISSADAFFVNVTRAPWVSSPWPRRAGVNSLGIGGTNAFAILEEAPAPAARELDTDRPCHVLTLSAKTPAALDALANRYKSYFDDEPDAAFADICYTTNAGRAHFAHRLAVAAATSREAAAWLDNRDADAVGPGPGSTQRPPRIAFLFTGQGSQYVGMGRELYEVNKTFRDAVNACAEKLSSHLGHRLLDVLYPPDGVRSPIDETSLTQPALFAIEYALATLWRSWGVEPSVVVGHSVGEIAAACVAGVFSLDDALRLCAERGRLMQALPRDGGMAAVRCDVARIRDAIAAHTADLAVAAINGPQDVVLSGRLEPLGRVLAALESDGVMVTRLKVSHAFHSPLMDAMLAEFERVAASVTYSLPTLPMVSNVDGQLATADVATPAYWVRHVREAVRFSDGVAAAHARGIDILLEIGPSPVLLGLARQTLPEGSEAWLASLRPCHSDWKQMAQSLAAMYARGVNVDWAEVHRDCDRRRVHLPTYAFQHQRYWIDPPARQAAGAPAAGQHPLLGRRLRLPNATEIRFESAWASDSPAYLDDHRIFDTVVVPGASHIAMALAGLKHVSGRDACVLEDVVFPEALTLPGDGVRAAQLIIAREQGREAAFQVLSHKGGDDNDETAWAVHATGRITHSEAASPAPVDIERWRSRCAPVASGPAFYDKFWQAGYHLRGAFRWIAETHVGEGEILCELRWPVLPDQPEAYPLYPSLIDSCFQCVFSELAGTLLRAGAVFVPFSIRRFRFYRAPAVGARLWCHATVSSPSRSGTGSVDADITLSDDTGAVIAHIDGCQLREVRREALLQESGSELEGALYDITWVPAPGETSAPAREKLDRGTWVVLTDETSTIGTELISHLQARQQHCIRVSRGQQFRALSESEYEIGSAADDYGRLLQEMGAANVASCRGVVHLWSLDAPTPDEWSSGVPHSRPVGEVLHLLRAIAATSWTQPPRLWLVTRGAQQVGEARSRLAVQQAPIWGLARVIALEHPELACVRVDLDPAGADEARQLFQDVYSPGQEDQLAYRSGQRYVARLVRTTAAPDARRIAPRPTGGAQPFQVRLSEYGQFDNLFLSPLARRAPARGEVELEVRAAALNFRDVLNALGLLREHYAQHLGVASAADMRFGFECAGRVVAVGDGVAHVAPGDEVIAVASHEALASFVTVNADFVIRKPPALSVEQAAALPLAFLTAYYGLHSLARVQRGERVLIHAAAGGVGVAAVRWAQHAGAEVFATASPAKWPFLQSLGVKHVMSSRTVDFAAAIADATGGEGVDVVLNSLSGLFVDASFAALKRGGRFVELGKREVWSEDRLRRERPDVQYLPFDLVQIANSSPSTIARMLEALVAHVEAGQMPPLPTTIFSVARVADAFRYMAEAKHTGKIVVSIPAAEACDMPLAGAVRGDASYLITGGVGALGLAIAGRLVADGARDLMLVSRKSTPESAAPAIDALRQAGANVTVMQADVSNAADVARIMTRVRDSMRPLRGIVHAAGVLDDGVLVQQTTERFDRVMAPKVAGTWHLHVATRALPLDFFVCFSSIASMLGNAGQGNYAAANAFMDALCQDRAAAGLPALSINWGPWAGVGMAAESTGQRQQRLAEQGFRSIDPEAGSRLFMSLLQSARTQVGVVPVNWSEYLNIHTTGRAFLSKVTRVSVEAAKPEGDIRSRLVEAPDPRAALAEYVRKVIAKALGMSDAHALDSRARLFDFGLESLMAVEVRGRLEKALGCSLRPTLLFDYPTIEALVDHLTDKLSISAPAVGLPASVAVVSVPSSPTDLEHLGEEDVAALLARELSLSPRARPS